MTVLSYFFGVSITPNENLVCIPIGMAVVVVVTEDNATDNAAEEDEGMVIPVMMTYLIQKFSKFVLRYYWLTDKT